MAGLIRPFVEQGFEVRRTNNRIYDRARQCHTCFGPIRLRKHLDRPLHDGRDMPRNSVGSVSSADNFLSRLTVGRELRESLGERLRNNRFVEAVRERSHGLDGRSQWPAVTIWT